MPYAIECDPHYYAGDGFGRDKRHLVTCYDRVGTIVLAEREDAETLVRLLDPADGCYHLDANQYAPPEYRVVDYRGTTKPMSLHAAMIERDLNFTAQGELASTPAALDAIIRDAG